MIDGQVSIIASLTDWGAAAKRQTGERCVASLLRAISTETAYKVALWWWLPASVCRAPSAAAGLFVDQLLP